MNLEPYSFGLPLKMGPGMVNYAHLSMETLVNGDPDNPGCYLPVLAESWELAPDKSSYTFHIRKGVKFFDGTDLDAQAVKWNHDQVLASAKPQLVKVSSIDLIDDYTLRYNLNSWDPLVMSDLVREECMIISPTAYEKLGEEGVQNNPVGTGPWMVKDYARSQHVKFMRNPNYWQEGLPYLDEVHILTIKDPMTQEASLLNGDVQVLHNVDRVTGAAMIARGFDYQTFVGQNVMIDFDSTTSESAWSDRRMREALEYAVDRDGICEALGEGLVTPSECIIHTIRSWGDPGIPVREYNPEKAKQLLAEAGYPDGIKCHLSYNRDQIDADFVVALQEDLANVGIIVDLDPMTSVQQRERQVLPHEGNELRLGAARYDPPNLLGAVRMDLCADSDHNPDTKRPDEFERLFALALTEVDTNKQVELALQMEKAAYEDAMLIPLWNNPMVAVYYDYVKGTNWYPTGPFPDLDYAWLDK